MPEHLSIKDNAMNLNNIINSIVKNSPKVKQIASVVLLVIDKLEEVLAHVEESKKTAKK